MKVVLFYYTACGSCFHKCCFDPNSCPKCIRLLARYVNLLTCWSEILDTYTHVVQYGNMEFALETRVMLWIILSSAVVRIHYKSVEKPEMWPSPPPNPLTKFCTHDYLMGAYSYTKKIQDDPSNCFLSPYSWNCADSTSFYVVSCNSHSLPQWGLLADIFAEYVIRRGFTQGYAFTELLQVRYSSSSWFQPLIPPLGSSTVVCQQQCRSVTFLVFLLFSTPCYTGSS